jgi:WD40 repeat protein
MHDASKSQDLGKIVYGMVDRCLIDKDFRYLFIAYNKGFLSKYCLKSFEMEHTWGKIHKGSVTEILITADSKY